MKDHARKKCFGRRPTDCDNLMVMPDYMDIATRLFISFNSVIKEMFIPLLFP